MMYRFLMVTLLGVFFSCGQSHDNQEKLIQEELLKDNGYTGDFEEKYPNGLLKIQGRMVNGKREGSWKYYYEDGMLWSRGYFRNDVYHGASSVYYPNGTLKMQGNYREGKSIGVWSFWAEDGRFIKKVDVEKEGFPEVD